MSYIEDAYEDYKQGMKYLEIAEKYGVSVNTVKSWKRRKGWKKNDSKTKNETRKISIKKCAPDPQVHTKKLRTKIELDLKKQLKELGLIKSYYVDLVDDYMSLWDIKNMLIDDIERRGVVITWDNGKQISEKKNDNISELNKTNAQMLKLLTQLGLDASNFVVEVGDDGDDV